MFKKGSLLREISVIVITALIASLIIKSFLIQFFYIPSGSMENTLQVGNRIGVNKFGSLISEIKRGEVVVFRDPDLWLGKVEPETGSKLVTTIKSGLITVGVIPDPAKQYLIKRVIGVGGDTVICCNKDGKLMVNGEAISEPYIYPGNSASDSNFNVKVPKGFIWVMGDHRAASADSRFHTDDVNQGMVPLNKVVGRAIVKVWPIKDIGTLPAGKSLKQLPVIKNP